MYLTSHPFITTNNQENRRKVSRFRTPIDSLPEIHICTKDLIISLPTGQRSNNPGNFHHYQIGSWTRKTGEEEEKKKKKKKKKKKNQEKRPDHIFYNNAHWPSKPQWSSRGQSCSRPRTKGQLDWDVKRPRRWTVPRESLEFLILRWVRGSLPCTTVPTWSTPYLLTTYGVLTTTSKCFGGCTPDATLFR